MKKIRFEGEEFYVLDETETHYVCPPYERNEGYNFISKEKAEVITESE